MFLFIKYALFNDADIRLCITERKIGNLLYCLTPCINRLTGTQTLFPKNKDNF